MAYYYCIHCTNCTFQQKVNLSTLYEEKETHWVAHFYFRGTHFIIIRNVCQLFNLKSIGNETTNHDGFVLFEQIKKESAHRPVFPSLAFIYSSANSIDFEYLL